MKKIIALVMCVLMLIPLFAACSHEIPDSTADTTTAFPDTDAPDVTTALQENTITVPDTPISYNSSMYSDTYIYYNKKLLSSNMQYVVEGENGYNKENLCNLPGCTHSWKTCPAPSSAKNIVIDNTTDAKLPIIYCSITNREETLTSGSAKYLLVRYDPNIGERTTLCDLERGISQLVLYGEYLYFNTTGDSRNNIPAETYYIHKDGGEPKSLFISEPYVLADIVNDCYILKTKDVSDFYIRYIAPINDISKLTVLQVDGTACESTFVIGHDLFGIVDGQLYRFDTSDVSSPKKIGEFKYFHGLTRVGRFAFDGTSKIYYNTFVAQRFSETPLPENFDENDIAIFDCKTGELTSIEIPIDDIIVTEIYVVRDGYLVGHGAIVPKGQKEGDSIIYAMNLETGEAKYSVVGKYEQNYVQ